MERAKFDESWFFKVDKPGVNLFNSSESKSNHINDSIVYIFSSIWEMRSAAVFLPYTLTLNFFAVNSKILTTVV